MCRQQPKYERQPTLIKMGACMQLYNNTILTLHLDVVNLLEDLEFLHLKIVCLPVFYRILTILSI